MNSTDNRTPRARAIALAGLFQAATLVRQTGQGRVRDEAATGASLASILKVDADSIEAVYGGVPSLRIGLETVASQFGDDSSRRDIELTGYAITLLSLERKLARNGPMLEELGDGIRQITTQVRDGGPRDPELIAQLADLYSRTISTLTPRILVHGDAGVLSGPATQNMIRALLLAGIRAAVLWHQCGGNRLRLIFGRRRILQSCTELLREARLDGVL